MKIDISQGLPILHVLFLICISQVFDVALTIFSKTVSVLLIDNLRFLASRNLVQKVAFNFKKTGEIILRWRLSNIVIYNITKSEPILFFKTCGKKAKKEIAAIKLIFGE